MTVAIALSAHRAQMFLEAGPGGIGPFLDNQKANKPLLSRESRIDPSRVSAIRFDAFCLLPKQRLLLEADQPVPLGSRALDILIALIERHGELVTRRELMARVWPGITVVDANSFGPRRRFTTSPTRRPRGQSLPRHNSWPRLSLCCADLDQRGPTPALSWLPLMEQDVDVRTMLTRLIGSADEVRRLASELLQASDLSVGGAHS